MGRVGGPSSGGGGGGGDALPRRRGCGVWGYSAHQQAPLPLLQEPPPFRAVNNRLEDDS